MKKTGSKKSRDTVPLSWDRDRGFYELTQTIVFKPVWIQELAFTKFSYFSIWGKGIIVIPFFLISMSKILFNDFLVQRALSPESIE